jgi:two-component system sensor histidine kinase HydH
MELSKELSKSGRPRAFPKWVFGGSLLMAAVAVVSLGTTVFIAQRALSDASDVIVRGEGDLLLQTITSDLLQDGSPVTPSLLEQERKAHEAEGLRYLALVDRDGVRVVAESGTAELRDAVLRPGQSKVKEKRVRVAGVMIPQRRPEHTRGDGPRPERPPGPPLLIAEFEPPVMETLRVDLTRISVVAAIAGAVLLAFAVAWSRSANRLAIVEERAARDNRLVALGSMSSVMAHELRNPLASLKGHAQLLVEDITDEAQRKGAERVVFEAERLEQLTTSLLDFVRDGPTELTEITPQELVARALEHLDAARITVDTDSAPKAIKVDATRLARAVHNLVENALQAAPEGNAEKVSLTIAHAANETRISVRDRGPGIPAGSEAQIFEPFITTRVRGTGLGLSVARRVAEQHGGTLTGTNHPEGGALFQLTLPDAAG